MDTINLSVLMSVEDKRWESAISSSMESFINEYILAALQHPKVVSQIPTEVEVSVVLTNDDEIRQINHEYRGKDKPTNVLSFPQEEDIASLGNMESCVLLGDIVLSIETIQREATQFNKPMEHHLAHLIVHGTLHLLGYDHEEDDEADVMESLEIDILTQRNIPNPYESDTSYMV